MRVGAVAVLLLVDEVANADGRQPGDHEKNSEPTEPVASTKDKIFNNQLTESDAWRTYYTDGCKTYYLELYDKAIPVIWWADEPQL